MLKEKMQPEKGTGASGLHYRFFKVCQERPHRDIGAEVRRK